MLNERRLVGGMNARRAGRTTDNWSERQIGKSNAR
ncbi:hypothetical protein HNO89_001074 [Sporosarcina luteola]|nr:hypothetical protein [Sporosarcina luteola]